MKFKLFCCNAVILVFMLNGFAFGQAAPIQWQNCLGGSNADIAFSMVATIDGGCIVGGYTQSSDGNITGYHGNRDIWITKLNSSGALQWQECIGTGHTETDFSISQTADNGYIIAGFVTVLDSTYIVSKKYFIVKTDDTGGIQWERTYGGIYYSSIAASIQQTFDGGYIVAGVSSCYDGDVMCGTWDSLALYNNPWILKLNDTGGIAWQVCIDDTTISDNVDAIRQTSDSGYILVGNFRNGDLIKFSANGSVQWEKNLNLYNADVRQTFDGGYILTGSNKIEKITDTGGVVWIKVIGDSSIDYTSSVWQTADSGYIVCGQTSDTALAGYHGGGDVWVVKSDAEGNVQWQNSLGGSDADYGIAVQQALDGNYVVACITNSDDGDVTGYHGMGDYWVVNLGSPASVNSLARKPAIMVIPNPTTGDIYIKGAGLINIKVYNTLGNLVRAADNTDNISISGFPPGTYFVTLSDNNGVVVYRNKLVKQ